MAHSGASGLLRNAALAAVTTVLFGALLEGGARFFEPPPVQRQEYLWDWSERFKDGNFYTLEKGEGYPPNEETSVDGLRDRTRPVETRQGLRRIVILGDSVTFGHGLEAAEAYPRQLERLLLDAGRDVEVFNVALPGWSTLQERFAYERIARRYKPDTVVLATCLNDLAELQINLTRPPAFLVSLFKRSAAVRLALGASRREIGAVEELFSDPDSARVGAAYRLFFEEARALHREVTKDGATFQMVVFPFKFQVEPKAPPPIAQRRLKEFATSENIPFLDFLPYLETLPSPEGLFLDYDHFNDTGHERVARWLAERLETNATAPPLAAQPATLSADQAIGVLRHPEAEGAREATLRALTAGAARLQASAPPDLARLKTQLVTLAVNDASARVRFFAAEALFGLGLPDATAIEPLIRGVKHQDARVRAFATWTLGEMGEDAQPAVPALVALARLDGGAGKTGALAAIGKIGGSSPEAIPLLLDDLKHPKEGRRYRAARTLARMGPAAAPAVPALIDALNDSSPVVRIHAARALASIGEAARRAVPALIDRVNKDADPEVRREASLALSKLPGR